MIVGEFQCFPPKLSWSMMLWLQFGALASPGLAPRDNLEVSNLTSAFMSPNDT